MFNQFLNPHEKGIQQVEEAFEILERIDVVRQLHRVLGKEHYSKSKKKKAIDHFNVTLGIASLFNWNPRNILDSFRTGRAILR